jgi:hypothetical protein
MSWLVHKDVDYFWYCIGGAVNPPILLGKWVGWQIHLHQWPVL